MPSKLALSSAILATLAITAACFDRSAPNTPAAKLPGDVEPTHSQSQDLTCLQVMPRMWQQLIRCSSQDPSQLSTHQWKDLAVDSKSFRECILRSVTIDSNLSASLNRTEQLQVKFHIDGYDEVFSLDDLAGKTLASNLRIELKKVDSESRTKILINYDTIFFAVSTAAKSKERLLFVKHASLFRGILCDIMKEFGIGSASDLDARAAALRSILESNSLPESIPQ
jgi:hypothetical protein